MPTIHLIPTQYKLSSSSLLISNPANMLTGIDSDTYATLLHSGTSSTYRVKLFGFDASQLPSDISADATFILKIKMSITSTLVSNAATGNYDNNATTPVSAWQSIDTASTDAAILSFTCFPDGTTSWSDFKAGLDAGYVGVMYPLKRKASGTSGSAYIYGAELEVTWGEQDTDKLYVKENGTYKEVSKAYKKVNGVYVEQTDAASVFVSGTNYKRGNS